MGGNLEGKLKRATLATGICLKGVSIYLAYFKGASYLLKKQYGEAAKYFFIISTPIDVPANILLATAGIFYFKKPLLKKIQYLGRMILTNKKFLEKLKNNKKY